MRTLTPRGTLAATVIALALVVTACGSDGGSDAKSNDDAVTTTTAASSDTTPGNPDTSLPTGEQICTKVPADVVGSTLGLEITKATGSDPGADQPPTCTYTYDGGTATLSVLRPLDMNGKAGAEGYKAFVELNKAFAKGAEYDEVPVDVGRQSVRFTGTTTHAVVSDTGTQVVQIVVPKGDASGDQVDTLLTKVVAAIG